MITRAASGSVHDDHGQNRGAQGLKPPSHRFDAGG